MHYWAIRLFILCVDQHCLCAKLTGQCAGFVEVTGMYALWLSYQLEARIFESGSSLSFLINSAFLLTKLAVAPTIRFQCGTIVSLTCKLLVFDWLGREGHFSLFRAFFCSAFLQYLCAVWAVGPFRNVLCSCSANFWVHMHHWDILLLCYVLTNIACV